MLPAVVPEETEPPEAELLSAPQHVVAVGVSATGTNYGLDDQIYLPNGVILQVTTLQASSTQLLAVAIINPGYLTGTAPTNPVAQVATDGKGTGGSFNLTWAAIPASELPTFPTFTPIYPPPPVGIPASLPTFPPTTGSTPITVPTGPLVGPAIAPAGVPPSDAGVVQPQYGSGSATSPLGSALFPNFNTTFPVPTIVISATFNNVTVAAGHTPPWTITAPPFTASTPPLH
jgi:hypothetical protein